MKNQLDLLIEFTKDPDARSRATAIAGLAKVADPRGFAPVLVALFDPVDEVRIAAATALGVFADDRAFEPLVVCLEDQCQQVAINSAWALGQLPGDKATLKLVELLEEASASKALLTAATTALGERTGSPANSFLDDEALVERVRVALLATLQAQDDELRATAYWSLGHLPCTDETFQVYVDALEDPYEWVVRYAAEALANTGEQRALAPLKTLAGHSCEAVRELSQRAIEQILTMLN